MPTLNISYGILDQTLNQKPIDCEPRVERQLIMIECRAEDTSDDKQLEIAINNKYMRRVY